ncbi:axoneme-associated protein mst101(2) [Drosophila gunungcola]|uniref:axoneme-associated protein mst101(2) n=1 Tax=Drosophila gunungcola TaxID=103775 RepID=UPI0022E21684|nr:axoneme-associated protein mst101(2) [Drosophila gunungcola]
MFRRCISSQLQSLLICPRPRPFIQAWKKSKSNDSHSSRFSRQPLLTSLLFDPPMSCDILSSDLISPCSPPTIKYVHQKVNRKGRAYHKKTGADDLDSCLEKGGKCRHRPQSKKRKTDREMIQRLEDLMNDGVDGVRKMEGKREGKQMKMQIRKSTKGKVPKSRPSNTVSENNEDQEPKNSIKNFLSMIVAKSKEVRQQLEKGKQADLIRYNPAKKDKILQYKNKYRKHRQRKSKQQVPQTVIKDQPTSTADQNSTGPQNQEGIMLGNEALVQIQKSKAKSSEVGCPGESLQHSSKPNSSELLKDREEMLISTAKQETDCRLQSLKNSTSLTPVKETDLVKPEVSQTHLQNISPSSDQDKKIRGIKVNAIEQSTFKLASPEEVKAESKADIKLLDTCTCHTSIDSKPVNFIDMLKNQIHKQLWEHHENDLEKSKNISCEKKENKCASDIKKISPCSNPKIFFNQPQSCQDGKSLQDLLKNEIDKIPWHVPKNECEKKPRKTNKDFQVCFPMLCDGDQLKFRIAELIAKCMYLVDNNMESGSECKNIHTSENGNKDKELNKLVEHFWKHYLHYRSNQKNDICKPDESPTKKFNASPIENSEHDIMKHVETIIHQCELIKKANKKIEKCVKSEPKGKTTETGLTNTCQDEDLKQKCKEYEQKRKCSIALKKKKQGVKDVLKNICIEKCEDKYLRKISLLIEELQKKMEEDKLKITCRRHNEKKTSSEENLRKKIGPLELKKECMDIELRKTCAEEELKKNCAEKDLEEKCAEKQLKEKCAEGKLKEECVEKEIKDICAIEKLKKKLAEKELKESCAKKELEKCAEEELREKCGNEELKKKISELKLKKRCERDEQERKCKEFSLRKRCAEFELKKKCEENRRKIAKQKLVDDIKRKCATYDYKEKRAEKQLKLKNKSAEENLTKINSNLALERDDEKNISSLEKLKNKVGLSRKSSKGNTHKNKCTSTESSKKLPMTELRKWREAINRRKKFVDAEIKNWSKKDEFRRWLNLRKKNKPIRTKSIDDCKKCNAMRNEGLRNRPENGQNLEFQGLGIFLRSALSRPRQRPLPGLKSGLCDPIPAQGDDDKEKLFNPRQWPLFPEYASAYKPTTRRTPLLESNFFLRRLLPDLKPLSINDTLGYYLNRINPSPFGRRGYTKDEFGKGSSLLWPFSTFARRNFKDETD